MKRYLITTPHIQFTVKADSVEHCDDKAVANLIRWNLPCHLDEIIRKDITDEGQKYREELSKRDKS